MKTKQWLAVFVCILIHGFISGQMIESNQTQKEQSKVLFKSNTESITSIPVINSPDNLKADCLTCPSYDYYISALSLFQTHTSSIVSNGCKIYLISVSPGSVYTFKTGCGDGATAAFDTYLELYDSGCSFITGNDDGCESARSIITWTATYYGNAYLKVRGYNSSYYGSYTLAYKSDPWCVTCPSYDYSITPTGTNQTHSSSISSYGCRIYYMNVTSGNQYTFKTGCGDGATADYDTYIELYNSSCSLLYADDDGCESNRSVINWTATYTGAAYLKVKAYSTYFGSYNLAYRGYNPDLCKTCPSYDFTIIPYTYYQTHSSSILSDGCKIYALNVTSGKQYTFKTGCGDGATAGFDTHLELFESGCTTLAADDDGCESNRSIITWIASYTGTAYLKVRGYNSGAYGSYTLAYNEIQPPNIWLGTYSYQWENPINWNLGHVPTASEEVIIAPYGYQPCILSVSDQECYSLEIQAGANLVLDTKQLKVNWDVAISGNFTMSNESILRVTSDWWRNSATGSFSPGNGRIILEGAYFTNLFTDETFYILEISKLDPFGLVGINGSIIACQIYDWTMGGVKVVNGGTFTTWDLADNGLFGIWSIDNTGGTINACNFDGYVDLNGYIYINGGTMNVYGGATYSTWPWEDNAGIYMTDGILDFKDQGISIYDHPTYSLTENITGGTIRTSKGFSCNRADFTPSDGTFEFYGTSDYTINQSNGCTLHHVLINKGAKEGEKSYPVGPLIDERSGMTISDGGKSNAISLDSDFTITGNLTINSGSTFNLLGYNCNVTQNVDISGILGITYPTDLSANRINWNSGSYDNITNGTIHVSQWYFYEGCFAHLGTGNTAYVSTGIYSNENTQFGNLVLANDSKGSSGTVTNEKGAYDLHVAGYFTVQTGPGWNIGVSTFIGGNMLLEPSSSISLNNDNTGISVTGNGEIAGSLDLPYSGNDFTVEGDLIIPSTGSIAINGGLLTCLHPGAANLNGQLIMNSNSLVSFPERDVIIGPSFNDNGITSGTLHFGKSLYAPTAGTFQINTVSTEFQSTSTSSDEIGLGTNNWLGNVTIQRSDYIELASDLTIKGDLTITDNQLQVSGKNLTVEGNLSIPHGTLTMQPFSQLHIGNSLDVGYYGTFESLGTLGNAVMVNKALSGNYLFTVNSGGVIRAEHTVFEDMGVDGIYIKSGAIVDPTYAFNYCTFNNGTAGNPLLTIENTQSLTITNAHFPANTWGGLCNIEKYDWPSATGTITMNSATGAFAGPAFECDPYDLINWTGGTAGLWTGNVSTDWFNISNWSNFTVPDAVVSVLIPPGCPNYPVLNGAQGHCYNLTVDPGANLTISNNKILASNNVYIGGNMTMTEAFGCLQAESIYFQAGSTDIVNWGEIRCDYFEFSENTLAKLSGLNTVYCEWMGNYETNAEFANLHIVPYSKSKSELPGKLDFFPLKITGDFVVEPGGWFDPPDNIFVDGNTLIQGTLGDYYGNDFDLTCQGGLDISGSVNMTYGCEFLIHGNLLFTGFLTIFPDCDFVCDYNSASGWTTLNGTLDLYPGSDFNITGANVLIGPSFNLIEQAPYPPYFNAGMTFGRSLSAPSPNFKADYIYTSFVGNNTGHYIDLNSSNYLLSFFVNKYSGGDYYLQSNLTIKDFIYISSATTLQAFDKTLIVGGNWTEDDYWPPAGDFEPGTGRVIFNGSADQTIDGQADFNILEINKTGGQLVIPTGSSATCNSYDFTAGGIRIDGGTFTANDLSDAGIYGNNQLISGVMSFTQDPLQELRFSGSLNIAGGIMNVSGGSADFLWGFYENCNVTMNNGTLNVNCPEGLAIGVNSPGIFTENITGGIIKVTNEIDILNPAFTPTGGTIEMIGPSSAGIAVTTNANLYHLTINKTATGDNLITEDNETGQQSKNGKANDVYLAANVNISGTLTVAKGLLNLNGYEARVSGDAYINNGGTLNINSGADLLMAANKILAVTEGGKLNVIGSVGNEARISRILAGNYTFNVDPGGTIGAQYGIFEYMGINGIYIKSGSFVDPLYPFNNCTFRNGISGGRLMTISNSQNFTVTNAVFPANTWGGSYNVYKNVASGTVNFVGATGDFAGAVFEYDPNSLVNWSTLAQTCDLKVYLEGPFTGTEMTTLLNSGGLIPLSQPYNVTPWNYSGAESVVSIPNSNIVDWVLIELRDAPSAAQATAATRIARQAAFLLKNGQIVGLNGSSPLQFSVSVTNQLFAIVWYRNHLGVMSSVGLTNVGGTYTYDFTTSAAQVYGGAAGHKQIGTGIWGMRSGDGDGNGVVNLNDKTLVWSLKAGKTGYFSSDFNLDRQTNNKDKNEKWIPNLNTNSQVPN